ncbi:MAG: bifunctional DNA-formamidopyrimidine glycosylase/DNA-(apurinic or apyrimidinic site) lyase [Patescibacteria group bacterium]|nr:MAG: bifunctional DNA-formamidopyrimidine glycosylase/DNA-(apurinic or apyrimidinic site) lyase [Patescibacteria group bacterium]
MPELPEVETIRKQLSKEVGGLSITDIWTDTPKMLRPSPKEILPRVKGKRIRAVERRAKLLIFRLSGKENLVLHLRLTGQLLLAHPPDPTDPYLHVTLKLSDGRELRFNDSRKFGYLSLVESDAELEKIISGYGPEPLSDLTLKKFGGIVGKTRRRIKDLLLDQKAISGIGNIYANEALWLAKIHPLVPASDLTDRQVARLYRAILKVLEDGVRLGGATIADEKYRNLYGKRGKYGEAVRVYQRKGKPCPRCGTLIEYLKVGQRGTFICKKCQVLD